MSPCFADLCRRAGKLTSLKTLTLHHFMSMASDSCWVEHRQGRSTVGNGCQDRSTSKSLNMPPIAEHECA
jgi:hypothetical protein